MHSMKSKPIENACSLYKMEWTCCLLHIHALAHHSHTHHSQTHHSHTLHSDTLHSDTHHSYTLTGTTQARTTTLRLISKSNIKYSQTQTTITHLDSLSYYPLPISCSHPPKLHIFNSGFWYKYIQRSLMRWWGKKRKMMDSVIDFISTVCNREKLNAELKLMKCRRIKLQVEHSDDAQNCSNFYLCTCHREISFDLAQMFGFYFQKRLFAFMGFISTESKFGSFGKK